ncbi:MAG: hypothetical protein HYV34_04485 [Candidatus Kerfeldbacteria bacterium]|nr:hypothetical protein [Candidatus Kerfeldbacteria bacterium]
MEERRAGRSPKRFLFLERAKAFFARLEENPDQERRAIAIFIAGVGVVALIFGYLGIRQNLREPYAYLYKDVSDEELAAIQKQISDVFNKETNTLQDLQKKDTDADGLNDYNELYVYATSPYLLDTDGDTFSDSQEVNSGNDPNCPSGQQCGSRVEPADTTLPDPETASPDEIRAVLLQAGIDQEALSFLSDTDLLALYTETVKETGLDLSKITPEKIVEILSRDQNEITAANITPAEIRDLLLLTGEVTREDLAGISDEELMATYEQVVQEEIGAALENTNQENQNVNQ